MTRFSSLGLAVAACLSGSISGALAQTLDVAQLPGGINITLSRDADAGQQILAANGSELLRAPAITIELDLQDLSGETVGLIVQAASEDGACPASPYALTLQFGAPWLRGPLGQPCTPYAAAAYPGGAVLFSLPSLAEDGDSLLFDIEQGPYRLGPISYAPQPGRGWDALDGEVGGYSDLSAFDLYAAEPVYTALQESWGDEVFILAQHLRSRSGPFIEGNLLVQTGCIPSQCAFAIGLITVDPAREQVFTATLNEGAPDIRPPLDAWSPDAVAVYETWRSGGYR